MNDADPHHAESPPRRVEIGRAEVRPTVYLAAGTVTPNVLLVPEKEAERILRTTAREIAGLPADSGEVVWVAGLSELLVRAGRIGLACGRGLVTVTLPVGCDQVADASIEVMFGVGTEEAPAGLVMSTLSRPAGPAPVVRAWGDALVAFAWEAIVHLARQLCATMGADASGQPLVPAFVGAGPDVLLVQPMARHRPVRWRR